MTLAPEHHAGRRARLAPIAELYPYESHFHQVDGGSMHYLDEGPREAAPVLALHGNPTWSFHFRALVDALSDERRVIVPDHMGMGLSDRPKDWRYDLEGHVSNLERLVLALDLKHLTLVLHDWGGAIGMGLATRHPERIGRIVVLNTAAFPGGRMPLRIALSRLPGMGRLAVQGGNAFLRAALSQAVEQPLPEAVRRGYLLPYLESQEREAIWRFVRDIPTTPQHPSFDTLQRIAKDLPCLANRPMSILWGERDWCFTPAFRRVWQERFPAAEVHRFEQAGHWVIEDAGSELLARLRVWLARTSPHPTERAS